MTFGSRLLLKLFILTPRQRPINRPPPRQLRLRLIPRSRPPLGARFKPRHRKQPLPRQHLIRPSLIRRIIRSNPPLPTRPQHPRHLRHHHRMHKPPLRMARLRPRVRKHQKQFSQCPISHLPNQRPRIISKNPQIRRRGRGLNPLRRQLRKHRAYPALKNFRGDQPNIQVRRSQSKRMFPPAKPNLQPNL